MRHVLQLMIFIAVTVLMTAAQPRAASALDMPSVQDMVAEQGNIITIRDSLHPDGVRQRSYRHSNRRGGSAKRNNRNGSSRWTRSYNSGRYNSNTYSSYNRSLHPDGPSQGVRRGTSYSGNRGYRYDEGAAREREVENNTPPRVFPYAN